MWRYELDDGTVQRFWAIGRRGPEVVIRTGALGTNGKERVKRHRNEARAKSAVDEAIRQMTSLGYVRVEQAAKAEVGPLLAAAVASGSTADWQVVADWWLDHVEDAAHREQVTLLSGALAHEAAGRDWRADAELDAMARAIEADWPASVQAAVEWGVGRPTSVTLRVSREGDFALGPVQKPFTRWMTAPLGQAVQRLDLDATGLLEGLNGTTHPALRRLRGRGGFDLQQLCTTFPNLESVVLDGYTTLKAFSARHLHALDLTLEGLDADRLGQLRFVRCPALRSLSLRVVESRLPDRFVDELVEVLAHCPDLVHLTLAGVGVQGLLASWLPTAPGVLASVEIEGSELTDGDWSALYQAIRSRPLLTAVVGVPDRGAGSGLDRLEIRGGVPITGSLYAEGTAGDPYESTME
jgi:predicted DNA-binding WGR domain protein